MNLPYQIDYDANNNVLDELHEQFVDKMCILVYVNLYFTHNQQSINTYFLNQYDQWNTLAINELFCSAKKILPELTFFQFREMFNLYINMILTQNSYINDGDIVSVSRQIIQVLLYNSSESVTTGT